MVTMDANSGYAGISNDPSGVWFASDQESNGESRRAGNRATGGHASLAVGPADVYRSAQRGQDCVETDLPGSVDSPDAASAQRNCYCGHCPGCRLQAETRREQMRDETDDLEESDRLEQAAEAGPGQLSDAEEREVDELRRRDQEVRAHEQAHAAAGARNVRYDYQAGPDGRQYAVGGSADIDIQTGSGDPDTKIAEAGKARAAAMAPADPSPKDMAVAARAARLEAEALAEKAQVERDEWTGKDDDAHAHADDDPLAPATAEPSHFFALA